MLPLLLASLAGQGDRLWYLAGYTVAQVAHMTPAEQLDLVKARRPRAAAAGAAALTRRSACPQRVMDAQPAFMASVEGQPRHEGGARMIANGDNTLRLRDVRFQPGDANNFATLREELRVLDRTGLLRGERFKRRHRWFFMPVGDLEAILSQRPTQMEARPR